MQLLLLKYWKQLAAVVAILVTLGFAYNYVYHQGYAASSKVYEQRIAQYNQKLDERISNIQALSGALVVQSDNNTHILLTDLSRLLAAGKVKPATTMKDGKCIPSQEFLDSYNALILRANTK